MIDELKRRARAIWGRTSNAVKAGAATAVFTFVGLFGASLAGWVDDVVEWASSSGATPFPDVGVLGAAAVAAAGAALTGLLNFVVRYLQAHGALPGTGPTYDGSMTVRENITLDITGVAEADVAEQIRQAMRRAPGGA